MRMKTKNSKRAKSSMRATMSLRSAKRSMRSAKVSVMSAMTRMTKRWSRAAKTRHLTGALVAGASFVVLLCVAGAALIASHDPSSSYPSAVVPRPGGDDDAPVKRSSRPAPSGHTSPSAGIRFAADTSEAATGEEAADDSATAASQKAVTIAGCLERDGQAFRLTDTTGAGTPKSRSWRSGFLRKRPASINVVDAGNKLKLPSQVGHRVSVTGTLDDREMHARSVQSATGSCG